MPAMSSSKQSLNNLLTLETNHLVDFSHLQRKAHYNPASPNVQSRPRVVSESSYKSDEIISPEKDYSGRAYNTVSYEERKWNDLSQPRTDRRWFFNSGKQTRQVQTVDMNHSKGQNDSSVSPFLQTLPQKHDLETLQGQVDTIF